VGAASGALLAVTLVSLLPEAAHLLAPPHLLLAVASGYLVFQIVGRYIYPVCPACAASKFDEKTTRRLRQTALLLAGALTLHSVMDGVAVAVGHAMHGSASDLPLLWAVSLHKLPEGLALSALLLSGGYAPRAAFLLTAAVEMTTFAGGVLGALLLTDISPFWLGVVLGHVGGGFLYLVLHTLWGGGLRRGGDGERAPGEAASQIGFGTLGFASVALLLWGVHRLH
jgi:zinc transporter ZupT